VREVARRAAVTAAATAADAAVTAAVVAVDAIAIAARAVRAEDRRPQCAEELRPLSEYDPAMRASVAGSCHSGRSGGDLE